MNEHQLAIGESTCASTFWAKPTSAGGKAQIEVRELSKLALQRTKTAREAIQLMGDLAVELGFYSAEWSGGDLSKGEWGESLQVVDPEEAWVFHITSDDTGTSAVWAAQRVPDGEVSAVANQFVIRGIDTSSSDFMYSKNIFEVAERAELWSKEVDGDVLDWTKTFTPPRMHPLYATRRVWRVFTLVNPSLDLDPDTDALASDYPFSVKPSKPLTQKDLMDIQRDHYEGTKFDMTKGLAAGPYGDPERWDPSVQEGLPEMKDVLQGAFERAISLFRTSYSIVCVSRAHMPDSVGALLWFSQYAPHTSTYSPFYVTSTEPPTSFTKGSLFKYDDSVSFWNFLSCGNWASRFYRFAQPVVKGVQDGLEVGYIAESHLLEQTAMDLLAVCKKENNCEENHVNEKVTEMLTQFTLSKGQHTTDTYRALFPQLMAQFHDGYSALQLEARDIKMTKMFYPKSWLQAVGFFNLGPNTADGAIMFDSEPSLVDTPYATASEYYAGVLSSGLFVGMVALGMGFVAGKREVFASISKYSYEPIGNKL
jgi:dipeptidase